MTSEIELYKIGPGTGKEVGSALIINIKETRVGSELDVTNLEKLLEYLNIKVKVKTDLTEKDLKSEIKEFASELDQDKTEICIICIMSHGDRESIQAVDRGKVNIETDILDQFSNGACPTMIGKPKVFLFQACRGNAEDPGMLAETDSLIEATVLNDAIIAFPSVPNFVAYRTSNYGSLFIKTVCDVFGEHAKTLEILDLFKIVQSRLKTCTVNRGKKITTEVTFRMEKHLYFHPKCEDIPN